MKFPFKSSKEGMDILDPEVIWIEGKCFRKLKIKDKSESEKSESERSSLPVKKKAIEFDDDDNCYNDVPHEMSKGTFHATHHVPNQLMGFLLGKNCATKTSIESQCEVKLQIPKREKDLPPLEIADVVILGDAQEFVNKAYRKIESILYDARWKVAEYTHFISIPMINKDIQIGFEKFKKDVLLKCKRTDGISEDLFVKPGSLHLTIAMLTLFNTKETENAKELLMNYESEILEIIGGEPLQVEVKGVEYMNDDPGEVDILYGKIKETDSSNSLQMIADKLSNAFAEKNFSPKQRQERQVKLHVTLVKSRKDNTGKRQTFDARKILAEYADYSFGFMTISEIHISIRFTAGHDYYKSSFVLSLEK